MSAEPSTTEAPAGRPLAERITGESESATPAKTTASESAEDAQTDGAPRALNGNGGLEEPEWDVEVSLADANLGSLQQDPNNPLFSIKQFNELGLSQEILNGLMEMNFRKPSKIQERALPLLLSNPPQNMIGQSQSGTGKTAAFTLNMLARVNLNDPSPQALVIAPSRELARQIAGVVHHMGQFMPKLNVSVAIPDPSKRGQRVEGHIVVGTPGTVMDMIRRRQLEALGIKILVLDEADNMLNQQGLGDQCKRVKQLLPREVQVVLFSATFPEQVKFYAEQFAPGANKITLKEQELTVEGIKQFFFDCNSEEHKYEVLVKFYGLLTIASSIIFVERRDTAAEIERRMTQDGHQVAQLSGALEGKDRDITIDRFRNGEAKVLIATNVLARGIDVQSVTMVINYDVPRLQRGDPDFETYLHRIGRTGRFGRVGVAVSFVHNESSWQQLMDISKHFKTTIMPLPTNDWDEVEEKVKRVIKSSRAGASTKEMQPVDDMQTDGAADLK